MASTPTATPATSNPVTIVTQTRVKPAYDADFSRWQQKTSAAIARVPGFLDQQVIPPSPPLQPDWAIIQRFENVNAAKAWLGSPERQRLLDEAHDWLVGQDDIHLVEDDGTHGTSSVSAVISMRIKPGQEGAYRAWGQRIAAAQARYPGFQGFKINPPVPGVQEDWVTILQFDNEAHLNAWMSSPERQALLADAQAFSTDTHARTVRTGFSQWFQVAGGAAQAPAWKQNMLTLLGLYPTVFLFGFFVGTPLLTKYLGLPFWLALFISNAASVTILNWLVPWLVHRFSWWLQPSGVDMQRRTLMGAVIIVALYALSLLIFSLFPPALP